MDTEADAPENETEPTTTPPDQTTADIAAEVAKWREMARKHERENRANLRELEKLRQEAMSDTEKAVAIARVEGRNEARREIGTRLVDAEVRAATAGRNLDVAALLEGLDRSRFLDDDGEPDATAIRKWVDRIAPLPADDEEQTVPRLRTGPRGEPKSDALNGDTFLRDLKRAVGLQ